MQDTSLPITKPPYPGAPTTTHVTGYFNSFDYPFMLHVPELNRQIQLAPREFLCLTVAGKDAKGNPKNTRIKINDPLFENYVGPNKLSKEETAELVPIVWLERPVLQPIPTHAYEFSATAKFTTDADGRVIIPESAAQGQAKQMSSVPASASSIAGYTIEQAYKLGIIKPAERGIIHEENETSTVMKTAPQKPAQPQPLPKAAAPIQPNSTRPTPPPFAPPQEERILAPKTIPASVKVTAPPASKVQVKVGQSQPVPVQQATPVQPQPVPLPTEADLQQLTSGAEDLFSDIPQDQGGSSMAAESVDIGNLSSEIAAKAGVAVEPKPAEPTLPEPQLPTSAEPTKEQAPIEATVPAPQAQPRRARRGHREPQQPAQ